MADIGLLCVCEDIEDFEREYAEDADTRFSRLEHGDYSLPILLAAASSRQVRRLLLRGPRDGESQRYLGAETVESGALEQSRALAQRAIAHCLDVLDEIAANATVLADLARLVLVQTLGAPLSAVTSP